MASDDGTLTMWNLSTYQCLKTLDLKDGFSYSII
jgi:WD40 repeat protein